jgi:cobalt transporter subunit CbtA
MTIFRAIVFAAVLAGSIAGLFLAAAHALGTVPLILEAETYESAAAETHDHDAGAWAPGEGLERTAFTALADVLTGIAFALLLTASYAWRGGDIDWRGGLFWGLAGFAVFTVAPGLGLPPELPGTEAAALPERQLWWVATAAATAAGLALICLTRHPVLAALGAVVVALPHLYGAPQPAGHASLVPARLAHDFVVAAVVTSFLFWLLLGSLSAVLYRRFASAHAPALEPAE